MAGEIVASNDLLQERSGALRTFFDTTHTLRLFSNDFTPSVKDKVGAFAEATFPGYAAVFMGGKWKPVFKVEDGAYQFSSLDVTFTATGPSNQKVFGWYLTAPGKLKLSCRLPFGVLMTVPATITVRVDCQTIAAVIC